uniref:Uncharacterized protein n=1 Tax=Anguilla anguilla TaxID=7936 RepID=A0A0E9RFC0_ANGAN
MQPVTQRFDPNENQMRKLAFQNYARKEKNKNKLPCRHIIQH